MIVIGLISGTSADGIDAAVADIRLEDGVLRLDPLGHRSVGYPETLRDALWTALPPTDAGPAELCYLDAELGQAFGRAAVRVNDEVADGRAELVVSHGQTIHHWVDGALIVVS
jgi:anhydro-N-acetylmuramic acid kinase